MKTSKSKTALRALVASLVLFGAAFQTNVAEAGCSASGSGITVTCSGSEGSCRIEGVVPTVLFCSGNQVAVEVDMKK